ELLAIVQQTLEGNRFRNRSVVEKHGKFSLRGQANKVGAGGIDSFSAHVFPGPYSDLTNSARLSGSQNCELDPEFRQQIKCLEIDRRFRQPHALGDPLKPIFEIS